MSAFIVADEHIHVLLWAGQRPSQRYGLLRWYYANPERDGYLDADTADAVGQMLVDENRASVDYRYSETNAHSVYRYRRPRHTEWSAGELLNALHCYRYQTCEHPGWADSQAYAFCTALEQRLISTVPGYETGPWAITGRTKPEPVREEPTLISAEQITQWAGGPLTREDKQRLGRCIPYSSIPEVIGTIVESWRSAQ